MVMKISFAFLMLLFVILPPFAAAPVFAQEQPSGEYQQPSAEEIVAKMRSKLNLTPDQVAAVTPIIEKYASKREELRQSMEDGTADRDSLRGQMKELRADENQELAQVLSQDQMSQLKSLMSRRRPQGGPDGQVPGPGGNGEGVGNNAGFSGSGE